MKQATRAPQHFRPHPLAMEISRVFTATAVLAAMPLAMAAPQGGTVTAGQAAIQQNGALTTITQGSQRAAIDWRSFNVGANETVNFVQPNASAAILNRVVGNDASAIFGRITGNGQVLLINPNGILFGRTAQVDVGALTATTSNLSNADFMAGRLNFNEPGKPGATVENQGRITVAEGGFVALVGRQVANSGVINARLGKVALAGGDAFVLDLYGDKLVNLIVDPAAMNALTDAQGQPLAARVDHSGEIVADGGRVQLSVATVKQLVDNLINLSGVVRATSFTNSAGVISLQGDANTRVNVSGTLDASGEQRGGRIEVTGRDVALQDGASVAARGGHRPNARGGDWQGQGSLAHAQQVNVAQGASLDASGDTQGQGGTVVLWSDQRTQFDGRVSVAGGSAGGDAGQVEVSSKGQLGFQGDVDVFAANGKQGSLLLDPLNLTIASTSVGDSQIAADQIRYFLTRGASVSLAADQNVTVNAEVNGLVSGGGGVTGGGLTLAAGNNLTVNHSIVLNDGALNLTAASGTLSQADATVLYTGSGAATLRGGAGVNLGQVLSGGAVNIRSDNGAVTVRNALVAATPTGALAPLASLDVNASGTVRLNGAYVQGDAAVRSRNADVALTSAVIQSRGGNVQVNAATGIASTGTNVGLMAQGTVTATAGQNIALDAVLGNGQIALTSTGGAVTLRQAVTGLDGSSQAQGLQVQASGAVTLAGANVGAGGINVNSTGGAVTLGGSSLYSAGPVNISGQGSVVLGNGVGISTTGNNGQVTLNSRAGSITVGNGGIDASGDGVNITLCSGVASGTACSGSAGDINVNGDIRTHAGAINLTASGGAVRVMATYAEEDVVNVANPEAALAANRAANATLDAGTDGAHSSINVVAGGAANTGGVTVGEMIAYNGISLTSTNGDVVLKRGLGGNDRDNNGVLLNTGYVNYADGYNGAVGHRPAVGRLVIQAGRSVELNGLNLDGNASPTDITNPGLSVTAGRRVVSNNEIAVNKGNIELIGRGSDVTDGVYLGSSVYSRGYETVNSGVRQKVGYGIRVEGRVLALFDNTREMAQLPVETFRVTWDEVTSGQPTVHRDVLADALGFLVDEAGIRLRNQDGSYRQVGYLSPARQGQTWPAEDLRIYNVTREGTVAPGYTNAGTSVMGVRGSLNSSFIQEIAKIEIANNAANYQDSNHLRTLEPLSPGLGAAPQVIINTDTIAGIGGSYVPQRPLRISDPMPSLVDPSQARIESSTTTPNVQNATRGIGLKLLTFSEGGDRSSLIWSTQVTLSQSGQPLLGQRDIGVSVLSNGDFTTTSAYNVIAERRYVDNQGNFAFESLVVGTARYVFRFETGSTQIARLLRYEPTNAIDLGTLPAFNPANGTNPTAWALRDVGPVGVRLVQPDLLEPGTVAGVSIAASNFGALPSMFPGASIQVGSRLSPTFDVMHGHLTQGTLGANISYSSDYLGDPRYSVGRSLAEVRTGGDAPGSRVFVYDGVVSTARGTYQIDSNTGVITPGLGSIPGANNSSVGFSGVGAGFDMVRGGASGAPVGGGFSPAGQSGLGTPIAVDDRSAQDVQAINTGMTSDNLLGADVIFGARAASQADLGRGGAVPGSAVNVFRRSYRLASSSNPGVCAPGVIQQTSVEGSGGTRDCAP